MELLPDRIGDPDELLLRLPMVSEAEQLHRIVDESLEHLRPWMGWAAREPQTLEQRRGYLSDCRLDREAGGDSVLGIWLAGRLIGMCGLHRRIAPDGLETGYWVHPAFTGQGLATWAGALQTAAAFSINSITHVEIHHDQANRASRRIPEKLGYTLVEEVPDKIVALAEVGIECRWRIDRDTWERERSGRLRHRGPARPAGGRPASASGSP